MEPSVAENRRLTRTIGTPNTRARAIEMGVPGRQDDYDRTVNTWIESRYLRPLMIWVVRPTADV